MFEEEEGTEPIVSWGIEGITEDDEDIGAKGGEFFTPPNAFILTLITPNKKDFF